MGRAAGFGCVAFMTLIVAASPARADRLDEATSNPAAVATTLETASEGATPVPARKADRLLELVAAYLDSAFDAGRRARRDAAPEHVASHSGQ